MRRNIAFVAVLALILQAWQCLTAQTVSVPVRPNAEPTDQKRRRHEPAKDDIYSIGNRRIGERGAGNWYSLESEIRMGREYASAVESREKLLHDPAVTEYVNQVGQNLVRNSDAKVPFTIKVIDAPEVNAFSLPGGFLYVNTGLILAADNEAELAAAMAHEIAHVAARHATRQMTRSNLLSLLSIPLTVFGGGAGFVFQELSALAVPLAFSRFSRNFEAEADYLGLEYMYVAGYDPEASISFFEKIQAMEQNKPGTLSRAFASHPPTADRVKKSQWEILHILPVREQYIVSTSEFDAIKARLFEGETIRNKGGDWGGPVLRRRTSDSAADNPQTESDDERPILKRRRQE